MSSRSTKALAFGFVGIALLPASLLGCVFFNEVPRLELWLGAAIIIGACLRSGWKSAHTEEAGLV